jgi:4-oxalocrotonate tautomerase
MPIISVQLLSGRTTEQKRALVKELAEGAMRALGAPEQSIRVILSEVEMEHWGVGTKTKAEIEGSK